jgi:hypothetical protein
MRHIKKALCYSVAGSLGLTVIASLQGCGDQTPQPPASSGFGTTTTDNLEQNYFLVIEQTGTAPDTYQLLEQHPTDGPTRAILRLPDGTERFLSEAELKEIAEEEAARVEAGTSRLTQEDPGMQSGGLSLGETLLAAAGGALVGGMLANALMGNRNFQRNRQTYGSSRPTAAISQPANRPAPAAARAQPRSGFFGGSSNSSSGRASSSFGG